MNEAIILSLLSAVLLKREVASVLAAADISPASGPQSPALSLVPYFIWSDKKTRAASFFGSTCMDGTFTRCLPSDFSPA